MGFSNFGPEVLEVLSQILCEMAIYLGLAFVSLSVLFPDFVSLRPRSHYIVFNYDTNSF
jgi:hypothetical protein